MFKFIDSSDNVIALSLTNTITGDDLNAIMDRVEDMMAKQDNNPRQMVNRVNFGRSSWRFRQPDLTPYHRHDREHV